MVPFFFKNNNELNKFTKDYFLDLYYCNQYISLLLNYIYIYIKDLKIMLYNNLYLIFILIIYY